MTNIQPGRVSNPVPLSFEPLPDQKRGTFLTAHLKRRPIIKTPRHTAQPLPQRAGYVAVCSPQVWATTLTHIHILLWNALNNLMKHSKTMFLILKNYYIKCYCSMWYILKCTLIKGAPYQINYDLLKFIPVKSNYCLYPSNFKYKFSNNSSFKCLYIWWYSLFEKRV